MHILILGGTNDLHGCLDDYTKKRCNKAIELIKDIHTCIHKCIVHFSGGFNDRFNKMKNNVYNLGLSNANITKINLAKKIKKKLKYLKIEIKHNMKDPDQRDYFVSNKKIEKKGFKAIYNLDDGISELIKVYSDNNKKYLNNY